MKSDLPAKRILLTGATGFIGANLAARLVNLGCNPYVCLRKESNTWRINKILKKVNLLYLDLRDRERIEKVVSQIKPQIIFHCSAYGGFPFQRDYSEIIQANIIGTVNLLSACKREGFSCFINTGSSSEYGIKDKPIRESDALQPNGDYGVSKAAATLFCHSLAIRERLPIITLRLFSPYGYYEDKSRLIPSVIISCLRKENPKLSSPSPVRDFIFIEDVMDAYIKAAENSNKASRQVINIGYGKQYSVGQVAKKIIALLGCRMKPEWASMPNPRIEPNTWVADISKAKKLLNWQPEHKLEEGLINTIKWFKKNIHLYQ